MAYPDIPQNLLPFLSSFSSHTYMTCSPFPTTPWLKPVRWTSSFMSQRRNWEQAFSSLPLLRAYVQVEATLELNTVPSSVSPAGGGAIGKKDFYLHCPRYTVLFKLTLEEETERSKRGAIDRRRQCVERGDRLPPHRCRRITRAKTDALCGARKLAAAAAACWVRRRIFQ